MIAKIDVKILDPRIGDIFPTPKYQSAGAAGLDLIACPNETMSIAANSCELIPTGLAIHIKDPNYCATILPRSGLGHRHGLVLGNLVGLIDSDYQGPLMVSCWNRSNNAFKLEPGMRFAQLVILAIFRPELNFTSDFSVKSERGDAGFGSSGLR